MKTILKLFVYMLIGAGIGIIIVGPLIALIEGESITTVYSSIANKFSLQTVAEILWMLIAVLIAFILHIILHEGGHLVAGLLTGYRFVSFRFLNFTLINKDGRLQWRNFELAGTGGQCLMAPPDKPLEEINTRWYNAGGVLANIVIVLLSLVLVWAFDLPHWLNELLIIMAFIGIVTALTNGIPMKLGGVANDGFNLLQMEKDLPGKQSFCNILDINARSQEGETYSEMPERLFALPQPIDWKNSMHVGSVLSAVTRLLALHQWEDAYQLLTEALNHKNEYMMLYQLETENMMIQTCILSGRDDEARLHYTQEVQKHISQHASTQSDKQLTSMAVALALDNDRPKAEKILQNLEANRDKFIHQSDVAMSLDLMHHILTTRQPQ